MIDFKDFLLVNPGQNPDDHIAYMRQKRKRKDCEEEKKGLWHNIHQKRKRGEKMRKKGEKGAPTAAAMKSAQGENVNEKMTAAQKKKRLDMIRKAVEKINAKNAEKAKKDALRMMKDMDF